MAGFRFMFFLLSSLTIFSGCWWIGSKDDMTLTGNAEVFPDAGIDYALTGSIEENHQKVVDYFSGQGIRYRQEENDDEVMIITGPVAEPSEKRAKKIRRTAFLVRLSRETADSLCGQISITWIVESRDAKGQKWNVDQEDFTYIPASLKNIKKYFSAYRCERVVQK